MSKVNKTVSTELQPCKCARPAIQTMDYNKVSPADWDNPEPRINRVCSKCWSHWFGAPGAVKFFTKSEWDKQVAA